MVEVAEEQNEKSLKEDALNLHRAKRGKIEIIGKVQVNTIKELSLCYTPGVAYPCLEIKKDIARSYDYTSRSNMVAIVTDGTRVLGLGNIGAEASMPVMEGKALLLKKFGGVDAVPLAISSTNEEDIIAFVKMIEPSFGAINLEDIETPKAITILRKLQSTTNIPIFHDDSYGTGIVAYAALKNALKITRKRLKDAKIVVNGVGSAGIGIVNLLIGAGARNVIMCDRSGILYKGRSENMNDLKNEIADHTNKDIVKGALSDAVSGADVLIGVSNKGAFDSRIIGTMNQKPIVFALANPYPEIDYKDAIDAGAAIVATGRSDRPNQVNNMLAFPGFFRGILDTRASNINDSMLLSAADAIANTVKRLQLKADYIVPNFNDGKMAMKTTANVAFAVAKSAIDSKIARVDIDPDSVKDRYLSAIKRYKKIERLIEKI